MGDTKRLATVSVDRQVEPREVGEVDGAGHGHRHRAAGDEVGGVDRDGEVGAGDVLGAERRGRGLLARLDAAARVAGDRGGPRRLRGGAVDVDPRPGQPAEGDDEEQQQRMSSGVRRTSSTVARSLLVGEASTARSHGPGSGVVNRSVGPLATARTGRLKNGRMLSAWPVTTTVVVVAVPRVALTFGCTRTPEPSWASTLCASALPSLVGAALHPAGCEALLRDGLGDVGGVLPERELHDAQDQQQEQGRRDHELGRDRAALVLPTACVAMAIVAQLPGRSRCCGRSR